jgi:hypothetical protein
MNPGNAAAVRLSCHCAERIDSQIADSRPAHTSGNVSLAAREDSHATMTRRRDAATRSDRDPAHGTPIARWKARVTAARGHDRATLGTPRTRGCDAATGVALRTASQLLQSIHAFTPASDQRDSAAEQRYSLARAVPGLDAQRLAARLNSPRIEECS